MIISFVYWTKTFWQEDLETEWKPVSLNIEYEEVLKQGISRSKIDWSWQETNNFVANKFVTPDNSG